MRKIIALMLLSSYTHAHDPQHQSDWIGEHRYMSPITGKSCCGRMDCGVVDNDAVRRVEGGYEVHGWVRYFSYFGVNQQVDEFWPTNETLISEDGRYWRCQAMGERRCVFVPSPPTSWR